MWLKYNYLSWLNTTIKNKGGYRGPVGTHYSTSGIKPKVIKIMVDDKFIPSMRWIAGLRVSGSIYDSSATKGLETHLVQ